MGAKTIDSVDVMKYFSYYLLYTKAICNASTFYLSSCSAALAAAELSIFAYNDISATHSTLSLSQNKVTGIIAIQKYIK